MLVLAALSKEDAYGYKLTQQIRQVIDVSESTLYPVLRRLKKDGLLETYDEPYDGRNRRYYHVSKDGRLRLESLTKEWTEFSGRVNALVFGSIDEKPQ